MRLRDLREDQPLSLPDAATYLGKLTGRKPHVSTLWRWCLKGCKGIRLESLRVGGKRFVTMAAIDQFVEALTAADGRQPEPPTTPAAPASLAKGTLAHVMRHNDRRREEIASVRRRLDELTGPAKRPTSATRSAG